MRFPVNVGVEVGPLDLGVGLRADIKAGELVAGAAVAGAAGGIAYLLGGGTPIIVGSAVVGAIAGVGTAQAVREYTPWNVEATPVPSKKSDLEEMRESLDRMNAKIDADIGEIKTALKAQAPSTSNSERAAKLEEVEKGLNQVDKELGKPVGNKKNEKAAASA